MAFAKILKKFSTNRKYAAINATDCAGCRCVAISAVTSIAVTYFHFVLVSFAAIIKSTKFESRICNSMDGVKFE